MISRIIPNTRSAASSGIWLMAVCTPSSFGDHQESYMAPVMARVRCSFQLPASLAQHALEDCVDIAQLPRVVEGFFEPLLRQQFCDLGVELDFALEVQIFFPGAHGVAL